MKIIEGSAKVPVIYTAHHASHDFGEFSDRVALTEEQKIRFSDYGTDITVPLNGLAAIIATRSRALGDLNRDPVDPGRFHTLDYAKPSKHEIWKPGQELTVSEKQYCQDKFYTPFHNKITELLTERDGLTFVVAWDNTAHYEIGKNENGEAVTMKPFILSNRGKEESSDATANEPTSCDPEFLKLLVDAFKNELDICGLPNEVHLNLVFKGGYICQQYSTDRNSSDLAKKGVHSEVQSLQLEYDTAITHDQETLELLPDKAQSLQSAFSKAFEIAYQEYLQRR